MATTTARSLNNIASPNGSNRYTAVDINSPKYGNNNNTKDPPNKEGSTTVGGVPNPPPQPNNDINSSISLSKTNNSSNGNNTTTNLSDDALVSPALSSLDSEGGFHDTKDDYSAITTNNSSSSSAATFTVRSVVPLTTTNESTTISPGPNGALRQTPPSTPSQQRNNNVSFPRNNPTVGTTNEIHSQHHQAQSNDHEVPAALAALLHQTDKSGKHQQKATPHGTNISSPASLSSSSSSGSSNSSVPFPSLSSGTSTMSSSASSTTNSIASSTSSSSTNPRSSASSMGQYNPINENNTLHASSSTGSNRGLFSAFCCFSPAAVPVDVNATTALVSNTENNSTDHTLAHQENSTNTQRYSDNPSDNINTNRNNGSTAVSPPNSSSGGGSVSFPGTNRPTLSLNISSRTLNNNNNYSGTETPSRRRLVNGRSGEDTPSKVLSPTSLTVRSTMELYGKQAVPPWGSQHPAIIHANIMAHSHGRHFSSPYQPKGKMNNNNSGYAFGNSGGTGYHYPSSLGYNNPTSTPIGNQTGAATPGGPLPSSKKKVKRTGPRPSPPVIRINNVRRPASTVGEGPLLAPLLECDLGKPCLVLDLDETLVHSSFKPVPNSDYILPVEIEGIVHQVYVIKRPGCDEFLDRLGKTYEIVIFTASLAKYADPLLDLLDKTNVIRARLFREACVYHEGNYVKDLSLLGRDPRYTIIVDNSPASYLFQPENALACDSFIDDLNDTELYVLHDFLQSVRRVKDIRPILHQWATGTYNGVSNDEVHSDSDGEGGGASMYHPHLDFYDPVDGGPDLNDDKDTKRKLSTHGENVEFSSDDDTNTHRNGVSNNNGNKLVSKFDAVITSPNRTPSSRILTNNR